MTLPLARLTGTHITTSNDEESSMRRKSLWADEPVMRDGECLDIAHKALEAAITAQSNLINAITAPNPNVWLGAAESEAVELLEHIRSMRAVLK